MYDNFGNPSHKQRRHAGEHGGERNG